MGEIKFVGTGETRGYPYLVCKKLIVLPMDWDSLHATLKVTSELLLSEVTSFLHHHEKNEWRSEKAVMRRTVS